MKKETVVVAVMSIFTALGFAQTPQNVDGWSIYPGRGAQNITLLQTSSLADANAPSQADTLKLDVVCKQGKLYRIAFETQDPISERATHYNGTLPTTPVFLRADAGGTEVQNWAVLDDGHTVSPYSEVRLAKKNRVWVERLGGVDTLAIEFRGGPQEAPIRARFHTAGISQAMASAGCTN